MNRLLSVIFTFIISSSVYGQTAKSTVILLSIDGFSYDYLATYKPKNILTFGKTGATAKLLPIYPSKTFPNHLSIITGVYPNKHGIIHNKFYHPNIGKKYHLGAGKQNSAWLTAQPLWSLAEKNNITSAVYFWPESQAIGQGSLPSFNIPYNKTSTSKDHFDQIIEWLKLPQEQAPKFIISYFSSVDDAGHKFGLGSPELAQAVANIDSMFGYFIERLKNEISQSVNIILLSDHGMIQMDKNKKISFAKVFNQKILEFITEKSVVVAQSSTQLFVYFNQQKLTKQQQNTINQEIITRQKSHHNLYNVYQQTNYPQHWKLNNKLAITPDLIIEAVPTVSFINTKYTSTNLATHGYDALNQSELTAIFFAAGPDIVNINKGKAVAPFENIHIVPFMAQLLGIKQPKGIDGKKAVLAPLIKAN
ncbi:MAG: hypothetical protein COB83_01825 [Gammaproteobacteria bacterium]|nr:MAG: hypothetical protein COB83_09035 [Gammaproteobacteria bacterium]PCH97681.1 MAG: hypothetical protein COB83_01825 [Gammaproteobacteria bacterium]